MSAQRSFGPTGAFYLTLFFLYLFGPLLVMIVTAFNSSGFPRISPWDCLTADWFHKLASDEKLLTGLGTSFIIGLGVMVVAVPIGLAAAMVLSQVGPHLRSILYAIFIAPILMPGVVIGLSTLIFWDRLGTFFNAGYNSLFYDGMFLTIIGQVTFISAYSMLIFLSRLQRFDPTLTEAALDMGATQTQAFVKVLLPFMTPAILSAAVLAFLASMENYNTTVFTIVADATFTTVLSQKVRYGLDPSISAVAVIIVGFTLVGAILFETWKRSQARAARPAVIGTTERAFVRLVRHPATITALVLGCCAAAFIWVKTYDSSACIAHVEEMKRAYQQELQDEQRPATPSAPAEKPPAANAPAANTGAFAPGNLAPATLAPAAPAKPASPFGSAFSPDNLKGGD
ncbi:ABC transporter permease [Rhizobium halophytocola]|uniref:Spermidine/putrescine transport system permease protein n=1 Tax=Rhizobium halophytocola TaxID=735519 RepID=A0ABS4DSV4_9HYPH|nr:ABC transporter permease [Rhizobium halophytocola]MBP1848775.1 spermidine/putrescine transport system permease protein [Rhizobium halophytocola]